MSTLRKMPGERGLYLNPESGTYFIRIQTGGRDTFQSLETTRKAEAKKRIYERRGAKAASRLGMGIVDPDKPKAAPVTVAEVINAYKAAGFPDRKGKPRPEGRHIRCETDACETLLSYFKGGQLAEYLRPMALDDYHDWRVEGVSKGDGHRTTDLELNTLANALQYAVRRELIKVNPLAGRVRYHSSTNARHAKAMAPSDTEELHEIVGHLFAERRSEVLGWQAMFEAQTGLRTNEALTLRMDARPDEPGGLTADGGSLCVRRSKKSGRENPYVQVHAGLRQLLDAHKAWHAQRYPKSSWYFPGRDRDADQSADKSVLTKALARLHKTKLVKKKITSHGLRAFYVMVRRSNGISDSQIAWEINHIGGVSTLESVYGAVPPHWLDGNGPKLGWIPKSAPAWSKIKPVEGVV